MTDHTHMMHRLTVEEQEEFIMEEYSTGWAARAEQVSQEGVEDVYKAVQEPDDEIIKSGVSPDNIRKWRVLQSVQDRNETLFYRCTVEQCSRVNFVQAVDG